MAEYKSLPGRNTYAATEGIVQELTVQHWFEKNSVEDHPNVSDCFVPRAGLARMQSVEEGDVSKKSYKRLHRLAIFANCGIRKQ